MSRVGQGGREFCDVTERAQLIVAFQCAQRSLNNDGEAKRTDATIRFGGCDDSAIDCLPIIPVNDHGWAVCALANGVLELAHQPDSAFSKTLAKRAKGLRRFRCG
jgi:hypothetical protein